MAAPDEANKRHLFGIAFDDLGKEEAAKRIINMAKNRIGGFIVTPNGNITQYALQNAPFSSLLRKAALTLPDGVSITIAARLLGKCFVNGRVAGVDLGEKVLSLAADEGLSVYLFGGKQGIAEKAASCLCRRYPLLRIAGCENGYGKEVGAVAENALNSRADILFCCLGSPLQELFAASLCDKLPIPVLCLGGSLDIYASCKRRAPRFFRVIGCEWLWRTFTEPGRIARLPALFSFFGKILAAKCQKALAIPAPKGYNERK